MCVGTNGPLALVDRISSVVEQFAGFVADRLADMFSGFAYIFSDLLSCVTNLFAGFFCVPAKLFAGVLYIFADLTENIFAGVCITKSTRRDET